MPNSKENVKNQKSAKLHSIVYSSFCDVDKEKEKEKKYVKDKESAKLHSIVYSSFCDGYKEYKEKEDNNDIKDKDKEYIKEDSFKYDWDWIKDVGEYILNDPFMQSHRGREYAIKIGLIKEVPEESVKPEMKFNIETTDFKQKEKKIYYSNLKLNDITSDYFNS